MDGFRKGGRAPGRRSTRAPDEDPLSDGPVRERIDEGIEAFLVAARGSVDDEAWAEQRWEEILSHDWIAAVCRIILRARNYRHGGALLVTPDAKHEFLNIKYPLGYERVRDTLLGHAVHRIQETDATDAIHAMLDEDADDLPMMLYLDQAVEEPNEKTTSARSTGLCGSCHC